MKQTEMLGLNLMEGTDRMSPSPINENMERIEEAYNGLKLAMQQSIALAVGRGGHAARLAFGSYTGTGSVIPDETSSNAVNIETEFKPVLVAVMAPDGDYLLLMYPSDITEDIKGGSGVANSRLTVSWEDRAISWVHTPPNATAAFNVSGSVYRWVALGYDDSAEAEE